MEFQETVDETGWRCTIFLYIAESLARKWSLTIFFLTQCNVVDVVYVLLNLPLQGSIMYRNGSPVGL